MTEHLTADVAVIGGGLMGCAAALALRTRGRSVVLIEQGWCGAQASGVNYGGVRRQGRPAAQLPLAQRAHELWATLSKRLDTDIEYVRSGHLKLAADAEGMAELTDYAAMAARFGLPVALLDGDAVRARYPWLSHRVAGASLCAEDGQANPRLFAAGYAQAVRRAGARVIERTAVGAVTARAAGFRVVAHHAETGARVHVDAAQVMNCAGAWGAKLAAYFGEFVPEAPIHPNMLVTEPLPPSMSINVGVVGGGFYARQVDRGNVVIGGGRAQGGLSLFGNRPVSMRTADALATAAGFIPALRHALVIRSWTGVEGGMPDKQPVLGPSLTTPGVFHAFGFSGGGFQLAPGVGEVLADLACDGATPTPLHAFRIDRFVGPLPALDTPRTTSALSTPILQSAPGASL